jgi:hypothetical protein
MIFAFALFAAIGASGPDYVIAGRQCAPMRCAARRLRRICPCRRIRRDALPAA